MRWGDRVKERGGCERGGNGVKVTKGLVRQGSVDSVERVISVGCLCPEV